jgi:hypothetical protein
MSMMVVADAGTPLIWLTMGHLLCGNFALGIVEAVLIARVFRVPMGRALLWMVPANYFSMIAGALLLTSPWMAGGANWFLGDEPLYRIGWLVGLSAILSFGLSILLEWPFVVGAMWKVQHGAGRTLLASLAAQATSYAILLMLYGGVSSLSVLSAPKVTRDRDWIKNPEASVFYIGQRDRCVYQLPLKGSGARKVGEPATGEYEALVLKTGADGKTVDLCLVDSNKPPRIVVAGLAKADAAIAEDANAGQWSHWAALGEGPAVDLREPNDRTWEVRTGFWPGEGLFAKNSKSGERMQVALETPFVSWGSRRATILPGDQVIYEVGNQVVVLDLASKRMVMLARGYSPIVILGDRKAPADSGIGR